MNNLRPFDRSLVRYPTVWPAFSLNTGALLFRPLDRHARPSRTFNTSETSRCQLVTCAFPAARPSSTAKPLPGRLPGVFICRTRVYLSANGRGSPDSPARVARQPAPSIDNIWESVSDVDLTARQLARLRHSRPPERVDGQNESKE